jgi:hypothetical protein
MPAFISCSRARNEAALAKIDFVHLSNLEDFGDEHKLGAAVIEILRRGDMTPESQRWLARCFEPDRGRRKRDRNEEAQTKFRQLVFCAKSISRLMNILMTVWTRGGS